MYNIPYRGCRACVWEPLISCAGSPDHVHYFTLILVHQSPPLRSCDSCLLPYLVHKQRCAAGWCVWTEHVCSHSSSSSSPNRRPQSTFSGLRKGKEISVELKFKVKGRCGKTNLCVDVYIMAQLSRTKQCQTSSPWMDPLCTYLGVVFFFWTRTIASVRLSGMVIGSTSLSLSLLSCSYILCCSNNRQKQHAKVRGWALLPLLQLTGLATSAS